jgi:hypothetical protein
MVTGPNGELVPGRAYCHACELWFDAWHGLNSHIQWHYARLVESEGAPKDEVEWRKLMWRAMNALDGSDEPPPADGAIRITLSEEDRAALEAEGDDEPP